MCPPMSAHGRHLANTTERVLTGVDNANGKSIGSAVVAHLTAEKFLYFTMASLSPKLPLPMGDLEPHLSHDSLGPSELTTQTVSRLVQPFLHR